MDESLKLLDC